MGRRRSCCWVWWRALLARVAVLVAFGQALGAKSRHQRAADLAAVSAAVAMRDAYPRLFELRAERADARRISSRLARERALRAGRANGVTLRAADVSFPGGSFAPTRVKVVARGGGEVRVGRAAAAVPVRASATAELAPASDAIARRPGARAAAAATTARSPTGWGRGCARTWRRRSTGWRRRRAATGSRCRSRAPSARTPSRRDCSPPTRTRSGSRRRAPACTATPPSSTSARLPPTPGSPPTPAPFGFIHRYAWEPWHYGFGPNPRDREHPAQYERGSWEPPGGDHGRIAPPASVVRAAALPRPDRRGGAALERADGAAGRAALRGVRLQPVRRERRPARAGSPSSCRARRASTGLTDPHDPVASIDAQAHLMSDLLRRFGGKVALALAAYNAGAGRGGRATAASRRSRRRAPTWRGSSGCSAGPARSPAARSGR